MDKWLKLNHNLRHDSGSGTARRRTLPPEALEAGDVVVSPVALPEAWHCIFLAFSGAFKPFS